MPTSGFQRLLFFLILALAALPDLSRCRRLVRPLETALQAAKVSRLRIRASSATANALAGAACSGMCCSNKRAAIPAGAPRMKSQWLSPNPPHGATIQIKSLTWGTWWGRNISAPWELTCASSTQPAPNTTFTVLRISATQIRLRTPAGSYVYAWPGSMAMGTTKKMRDPCTIFTLAYDAVRFNASFFRTCNGTYVTAGREGWLAHYTTTAEAWERFEVREVTEVAAIRGVNLGGWLVYEGWMNPALMPLSSTLLDGTAVSIWSVGLRKWVSAVGGGGGRLRCSAESAGLNETFHVLTTAPGANSYQLMTARWYFLSARLGSLASIMADVVAPTVQGRESFQFVVNPRNPWQVLLRSSSGFLKARPDGSLVPIGPAASAAITASSPGVWTGPLAFTLSIRDVLKGDWQLAYGLRQQASNVLPDAWRGFIQEADWAYLRRQGINAVRIPVAWWLTQDPKPDYPFVAGASQFLDWAMAMGARYGIRVWLSVHGVPGSQSGSQSTGSRDGYARFGSGDSVDKALRMVRWIAQRYAGNAVWLGMGLLNEPFGVSLSTLVSYYERAAAIVRSYSPCVFISMEGATSTWDVQWLLWDEPNVILETHIYSIFTPLLNETSEAEIQRAGAGNTQFITELQQFGRQLLIGEFSNAMRNPGPNGAAQKRFSLAQMQSFANAQAGWFFWSYKLNCSDSGWWDFRISNAKGWLPRKRNGQWY